MKRILVTGATGNIGRQVVNQLLSTDCQVRSLTRNPDRVGVDLPRQVKVVRGDFTDLNSLDSCFDGIDAVFLVWTVPGNTAPEVINRIARRAQRIVLLTSPHKTPHPFFQQPNPVQVLHATLERLIEESGLQWTFLRPGMFAANALGWWAPQIRVGDIICWPYAESPTAPIHEQDIAAVAVHALLESLHDRAEYVLTGPESLTQSAQVMTIGEVIGRTLRYEEMSPEEALRDLPFPATASKMLLDAWAAALGQPAYVTSTVREITGKPARSFRDWVLDNAQQFQA